MVSSVLVICTGNSCRSQMAEAYFRALTDGQWRCESAGTKPTEYVHPLAVTVMGEDAIDITAHTSKSLADLPTGCWDYVVTVCDSAVATCPVFPGADLVLHWSFPDPASARGSKEEILTAFRETRDAIKQRVSVFLRDLDSN